MSLLFESLFTKIERANQKMLESLEEGEYYEDHGEEIRGLNSILIEVCHDMKYNYAYEMSLEDADKVKLNEEMKKAQLLLHAIHMTKLNLESYTKYFKTKNENLHIMKNIMIADGFEGFDGLMSTSVKDIMTNKNKAAQFYKPLGFCDAKLSTDDDVWALSKDRCRELMNDFGVVDIDAKEYLKKWNKTFEVTTLYF
ncbi:hypothetical protein QPJ54_002942 [Listeria monocytogenes]|nr:hypothetical protein [Listeria monocytogenes]ECZ3726717.1 hypothetical protein [Listeria monocytogenes]EHT7837718.1 hypothetical protein [Listeria monocytogenes]EJF6553409.1 hypothetical protein [Listeria monocytogenes]EKB5973469.1 hypothetical protein [Listeria monocytogenes]